MVSEGEVGASVMYIAGEGEVGASMRYMSGRVRPALERVSEFVVT